MSEEIIFSLCKGPIHEGKLSLHSTCSRPEERPSQFGCYRRAWNVAANEDSLWRAQFLSLTLAPDLNSKILSLVGIREGDDWQGRSDNTGQLVQNQVDKPIGLWRKAFDLARQGKTMSVVLTIY